ncbi:MAG TPA: hypothetical protein PKD70_06300 [Saprospiraceae bacterium]|nr:hypothetical protein [Saprospiraceae bacterium]HMP13469.1 hypothetical protein [Saprospiraceae bacterium]
MKATIGNIPSVVISGKTYSAAQIVDKTLLARRPVNVYHITNLKKPFGQIKAGAPVGVVYSWIGPSNFTNGKMYWQFFRSDGSTYYAEHRSTDFDQSSLKQQGAITVLEQIESEKPPQGETWQRTITKIAVFSIVAYAAVSIISNTTGVGRRKIIYL